MNVRLTARMKMICVIENSGLKTFCIALNCKEHALDNVGKFERPFTVTFIGPSYADPNLMPALFMPALITPPRLNSGHFSLTLI